MWQSSKFKGQHKMLARMMAIGHQLMRSQADVHRYSVFNITKASATEAISLTVTAYHYYYTYIIG